MATFNYERALTIYEAVDGINNKKLLLPAIQRNFVWNPEQIEALFNSIMEGYPINTFMFWEIDSDQLQKLALGSKFYYFLNEYIEYWGDQNQLVNNPLSLGSFSAVIDGQQRLTSLYLGLCGTYALKSKSKRISPYVESNYPKMNLYMSLDEDANKREGYDSRFVFRWLEDSDVQKEPNRWFKMHDIFNLKDFTGFPKFITDRPSINTEFTWKVLAMLHKRFFEESLINRCVIKGTDLDTVLDIFIRTNSGGTKLSFSDLLMSVTINSWKRNDARKDFNLLVKEVRGIVNDKKYPFNIDNDFILKCCLMVFSKNDVKSRTKNFTNNVIDDICNNWDRFRKSIVESFRLIYTYWGIDGMALRANNAIIPIVYYVYTKNLQDSICLPNKQGLETTRDNMRKWLVASLLKGVFSSQTDSLLKNLRDVIAQSKAATFPYDEIKSHYATHATKNLSFNDDIIADILNTQYEDPSSNTILALLYPKAIANSYEGVNKDHLHPKNFFKDIEKQEIYQKWNQEEQEFAKEKNNWNSILNLQLIDSHINKTKNDMPLADWLNGESEDVLKDQYIPLIDEEGNKMDYSIGNFKSFIEQRKVLLTTAFKTQLQ